MCKYNDEYGEFYVCPGGGHEENENMTENVKRELFEELSVDIEVGDFAFIRETFFTYGEKTTHQIEHYFYCEIKNNGVLSRGQIVDSSCIGFEWLEIEKLDRFRTFPVKFREALLCKGTPLYIDETKF